MAIDQNLVMALYAAADRYQVNREVAYYQILQESNFNPMAVSASGAMGIAQFIPDTAARFNLKNPFDPIESFDAWGRYMRFMLDMFGGRYDLALAGYNSGENRAEYKAAAREGREINWSVLPARVQTETQAYVNGILKRAGYNAGLEPTITFEEETTPTWAAAGGGIGAVALFGVAALALLLLKR